MTSTPFALSHFFLFFFVAGGGGFAVPDYIFLYCTSVIVGFLVFFFFSFPFFFFLPFVYISFPKIGASSSITSKLLKLC